MKTPKKSALRKQLETVAKKYIQKFEKVHGVEFEYAVGDDLLGTLQFGDNFFSFSDIVYDIDHKLPVGLIFQWQNNCMQAHFNSSEQFINLQSYAMGLRYESVKNDVS